jgi:hypothetical protein
MCVCLASVSSPLSLPLLNCLKIVVAFTLPLIVPAQKSDISVLMYTDSYPTATVLFIPFVVVVVGGVVVVVVVVVVLLLVVWWW